MLRAIPRLAALALFVAAPALADIPPPPYTGPVQATLGGLDFVRGQGLNQPGQPGRRSYVVIKLQACHGRSHNCDVVTRAGVLGWGVIKSDGAWLSDGDIGELSRVFAHGRRAPVKLLFKDVSGRPPREVELTLDP